MQKIYGNINLLQAIEARSYVNNLVSSFLNSDIKSQRVVLTCNL